MPRSLSTVTDLVDVSVFTALVRLCEYESTACPSMFVTASLPPMKKVLYIYICVGIYSCDDVAQGHLIRERRLLVKLCSKLGQVLFVPGHPCCRYILVLIAGCVHSFKEFLHSVVVRRGHKSRHCPNRSLMFCHSATSCQPPPPYSRRTAQTSARSPSPSQGQPTIDRSAESRDIHWRISRTEQCCQILA